jgi:K+ transporter
VLVILASVVGSQAIISRTFSIINQSQSRSCFPRVKVVHTPLQRDNRYYKRENLLMVIKNNLLWRHLSMGLGYDDSNDSGVSPGSVWTT